MSSRPVSVACLAAAAALVAACTAIAPPTAKKAPVAEAVPGTTAAPGEAISAASAPGHTAVAVDADAAAGPAQVAVDWLVAYRTAAWDEPAGAWIDAVAPMVSARMNADNQQLRTGTAGAGWATFVQNRCMASVVESGAVIPPEAPASAATVHVQVAGTVRTVCQKGPKVPDEAVAATLTAIATEVGWRIDAREQ